MVLQGQGKSVLIVNICAIGDVVTGTIVSNYLKDQKYNIDIFVRPEVFDLLDRDDAINIVKYEEITNKSYDIVIDLTSNKYSNAIVRKVKAPVKIRRVKNIQQRILYSFTYNRFVERNRYNNIVRDFYPILELFGFDNSTDLFPSFKPTKKENDYFKDKFPSGKKKVSIHMGASNSKRWLPEKLVLDLVNYFHSRDMFVILLGVEEDLIKNIMNKTEKTPFYENFNIRDLKYVISNSDLFIGSDSGLLHIASAFGIKAIGIYGPNTKARSGPLSKNTIIIEKNLPCRPCDQNKYCKYNIKCLNDIKYEEVVNNIS